jgi:5-deoxy-5-amino-3-dehydroquinate synthase
VLCDTAVLATLPAREWACGNGEIAKYALLTGGDPVSLAAAPLDEKIARCVEIKADFVGSDEREAGRRALLNYGHTLAHALETAQSGAIDADLRHGEAVAIGLAFAARLASRLGRIDAERVRQHDDVLDVFGLRGELPESSSAIALVELMRSDKKANHSLAFVLDGPSGFELVEDVAERDVLATLRAMGAGS